MNASTLAARWRAVSDLQRLQDQRFGTIAADDAEHATTLALSDVRPTNNAKYLAYDALRDARRIRTRRRPVVPFSALRNAAASSWDADDDTIDDAIDFHVDRFGRNPDMPDEIAAAGELEEVLRRRLATTT